MSVPCKVLMESNTSRLIYVQALRYTSGSQTWFVPFPFLFLFPSELFYVVLPYTSVHPRPPPHTTSIFCVVLPYPSLHLRAHPHPTDIFCVGGCLPLPAVHGITRRHAPGMDVALIVFLFFGLSVCGCHIIRHCCCKHHHPHLLPGRCTPAGVFYPMYKVAILSNVHDSHSIREKR